MPDTGQEDDETSPTTGHMSNERIVVEPEPLMTMQQIEEDWHRRLAVETARSLGIFDSSPTR